MSTIETKADENQDETTTNNSARDSRPASGDRRDRDELPPTAGHNGILVAGRCTGCKTVRRKLAPTEILDMNGEHPSFRHICHDCQRVTWYNTMDIVEDVDDLDLDVDETSLANNGGDQ